MLSPKMQRTVRVNDSQLVMLSERAHYDHNMTGYLYKKTADSTKWQQRWFVLYQNLMFYYESDTCNRPSGVLLLEGCYCERLITAGSATKNKDGTDNKQYCFAISYRRENQRQYELRANSETDCKMWIEAIREASFNKLLLQKEELEQKHLHLLQIVESEKTAKWQYTQQCEELASEIKKLRAEVRSEHHWNQLKLCALKREWRPVPVKQTSLAGPLKEADELRKIKKVQSFFRGWLCRRRWKQIVEEYIKSPHAESMRKRNSLVFRMVESEEEYMEQMEVLVSCFLRPFRMAASSKKPPCSHEDVNSIFLNSETVLFLHQIFLKGLTSRMESWPTLVLGDLFDMLLPMLSIYQEYVRNHHYSLQVLTECKQSPAFAALLARLENKPACQGRSLETFLTYPMHQVPRYIITLHELLAHTPHDHVERKSLENARRQLEDLSRQMHDEVSETENLRKNLAVERMIVEGCDILLDVNQVFVRQGCLIQVLSDKQRSQRSRLTNFKTEKEALRQCFLFSNHLILATRTSGGRLHLLPDIGKIPLADAVLIEDPSESSAATDDDGMASSTAQSPQHLLKPASTREPGASVCSASSQSSGTSESSTTTGTAHLTSGHKSSDLHNRDFKIVLDVKSSSSGGGASQGSASNQITVHLVASTMQEKQAWISDISQCMDNVHFNDLLHSSMSDTSSVTMPQSIKNDPKLFKDDVDIRFSRTLNSCKVPQIRYATPERLLERLTDLRFLSIDFLNTFLLTYRVFTDGVTVLEALKRVFYSADPPDQPSAGPESFMAMEGITGREDPNMLHLYDTERRRSSALSPCRRTSGASSVSGYGSEMSDRDRSHSYDSQAGYSKGHWRCSFRKFEDDQVSGLQKIREATAITEVTVTASPGTPRKSVTLKVDPDGEAEPPGTKFLQIPKSIAVSSSSETLTGDTVTSVPSSPGNLSTMTLVASSSEDSGESDKTLAGRPIAKTESSSAPTHQPPPPPERTQPIRPPDPPPRPSKPPAVPARSSISARSERASVTEYEDQDDAELERAAALRSSSIGTANVASSFIQSYYAGRRSVVDTEGGGTVSQRASFQHDSPQTSSKAGVVITSFRQSQRSIGNEPLWSSTSSAAAAFAIATSASSNPRDHTPAVPVMPRASRCSVGDAMSLRGSCRDRNRRKESVMSTAATMRVLNVLRHWVSKHAQDFELDQRLKSMTIEFLDDITYSPNLLPAEHKAASQLLRLITREEPDHVKVDLERLLAAPKSPSKESIETLSALEIAEQMTYLDHQIFVSICSEEFLGQAWMKTDKANKAHHILLMTKRFNEVSRLVVSEIVRRDNLAARIAAIEKWAAVADISRCLHNFNGVLQICAAFTNSSVFRLKKTWEKVSKTTKQSIEKLQTIVSADGRFRNLRDALHRCDPPCIPYLGMYLTDLSFIEEGTPNFTDEGLLNFSKMRMIAHVIREIRHFQQTPYKIELIAKVTNYLLDPTLLLDDDQLYNMSLEIEPRTSRLGSAVGMSQCQDSN
ncbi:ras-specific guanine nucleotide-releasing factor 2-like isoform X3 [Neocloeon triangulifer]|uniref:ras-specific guanine nucleotide-releasing factor 2-like isoform X3 n=1 Tax=Neocloeon triangulifer TaxID=2078957 RepID=UPI00286F87B1|nr:ras-specific guanine nucleotide-releasing factor 2-like isoform X3 [Neocloeon triangulifer]